MIRDSVCGYVVVSVCVLVCVFLYMYSCDGALVRVMCEMVCVTKCLCYCW